MAYQPKIWTNNEAVSADALNNLEQGLAKATRLVESLQADINATGEDVADLFDSVDEIKNTLNPQP